MVARSDIAEDGRRNSRHARSNRDRTLSPFQIGDDRFDARHVGRAVTGVIALRVVAGSDLGANLGARQNVGRGLIDRLADRLTSHCWHDHWMLQSRFDTAHIPRHWMYLAKTSIPAKDMRT